MSIQVNPNANTINWDSLLSKLDAATKAAEAQAAGGVTAGQNITITTQVGGVEQSVTFPIPDDLDLPGEVDQAGIDSLCAKLASDPAYGLSEEEVKIIHEKLSEALAAAASSVSNTLAKGSTQVLFDLYKLMALLVEVGQKQRDASREMRTAQNQQVQKSILDQAEQQKSAAITGMWAGAICCFVQVVASIGMSISQGRAFNKQVKSLESSGGINVNRTISLTFAIGSALAAIAGALLCSFSPTLMPTTGSMPGIKAFTAAVFGGIGSIPGAFLGGILLGVIESLARGYISTQLSNSIVFAVLIVVLLVRPAGLLGKYVPEKV